ncbi:hypothetical protein EF888_03750 [Silicimonas algicola]|uniref:Excalibur calcium-binding domain-containing protein n=1 Tax=Silicimonas algicola TaxID=1826607 RepID=A0A316GGZ7_9RHOB|nr:hypothetical protein [Silicimonas algicola]AZQ66325.1 hypothetical protein EF888_03750 [Silicimonas algicola]PWK58650.1 hypothetical protein C8D95_101464 [Silicimonas algicola]
MTIRFLGLAALCALAACAPSMPDSNPASTAGVGFGDYDNYAAQRAARDAELERRSLPLPEERAIAEETLGVLNRTAAPGTTVASTTLPAAAAPAAGPGEPLSVIPLASGTTGSTSISDEQNFDAVASRETIQSDAARLARQRQSFEVAQPSALPERQEAGGAGIVQYALSTTNQVGQQAYRRNDRVTDSQYQRNCARYGSSDRAQEALLSSGGPERDRHGIDPDGDGFACYWDPSPFRAAMR